MPLSPRSQPQTERSPPSWILLSSSTCPDGCGPGSFSIPSAAKLNCLLCINSRGVQWTQDYDGYCQHSLIKEKFGETCGGECQPVVASNRNSLRSPARYPRHARNSKDPCPEFPLTFIFIQLQSNSSEGMLGRESRFHKNGKKMAILKSVFTIQKVDIDGLENFLMSPWLALLKSVSKLGQLFIALAHSARFPTLRPNPPSHAPWNFRHDVMPSRGALGDSLILIRF